MMKMTAAELAEEKAENKQLKQCIEFILEECRMVLPGIQALFGFQLIAVFNDRFSQLTPDDKIVHLAAIFFTVAAVGFLMGPASYHRLTTPNSMPPELCTIGTRLVCVGMAALMLSISLDIYLVTKMILESVTAGIISGGIALTFFASVWYIFPLLSKRGQHHHHSGDSSTPVML
jgi:multisubunit Na+/H+ antiporter MnhG subunit